MAAGRKLQAEIDKLLKKVDEGLEEFNNIWEGVHNATQPNQREKFETELKAQIKKLQRDREQIKTWLGDKSIKDKNPLAEARKRIEVEMERFKEFERDAKTKTYSKEGLLKSDKVDPEDEERRRHRTWIQDSVNKLEVQIDELDADIEVQLNKKGKNNTKEEAAVAHSKFLQETHRWHIMKLEQLLRKLDNDEVNIDELDDLRESVDFYVDENSREPGEFQEFDTIYEEFNLEEVEDYLAKDKDREKEDLEKEKEPEAVVPEKVKEEAVPKEDTKKEAAPKSVASKALPVSSRPKAASKAEEGHEGSKPWPPMVSVWQNPPPAPSQPEKEKAPPAVSPGPPPKPGALGARPAPSLPPPMQPAPDRPPPPGQAPVLNTPPNQPPPKPAPQMQPPTQAPPQPPLPSPPVGSPPRPAALVSGAAASGTPSASAPAMPAPPPMPPPAPQEGSASSAMTTPSVASGGLPSSNSNMSGSEPPSTAPPPPPPPVLPPPPPSSAPPGASTSTPVVTTTPAKKQPPVQQGSSTLTDRDPPHWPPPVSGVGQGRQAPKAPPPPSEAPPPPSEMPPPPPESGTVVGGSSPGDSMAGGLLPREVAPSVPFESGGLVPTLRPSEAAASSTSTSVEDASGPLSPRRLQSLQLLSASHRHLPAPSDSRRNRKYVPRNPYVHMDAAGNAAYHMQPTRNYEDPATFEKYDLDTLFFIFYYQQGSYQQHLAAKELKKLSWRYHTKYLTWFQRHEEPRMTAAEYERGAYVYFDHDSGWCQRIKSDFTFEYQFLEDEPM